MNRSYRDNRQDIYASSKKHLKYEIKTHARDRRLYAADTVNS